MKAAFILMFRDINLIVVPIFTFLAYVITNMSAQGPGWVDFIGASAGFCLGMLFLAIYEKVVE